MKKTTLFLLTCTLLNVSFAQKKRDWKTNFGLEFGLPIAGLTPATSPGNPLVQGGATLHNQMGFTASFFTQFIKTKKKSDGRIAPSFGIQLKALYNNFVSMADGTFPTYDDQTIKVSELALPILFKVCLVSMEKDVSSSRDPDKYEIRKGSRENEYEVWKYPGQYRAGYRTTVAIFLYAGPQVGYINSVTFESSSAAYKNGFESVKKNIKSTNLSVVGGIQFQGGRIYMDASYQKGLQSIYDGPEVLISGWIGRIGLVF